MTVDGFLFKAQAALSFLGQITCFYDENADPPPGDFGFGLSVVIGYIEDEVRQAYNLITETEEGAE